MSRRKDATAETIALFATKPIEDARTLLNHCKAVVEAREKGTAPKRVSTRSRSQPAGAAVDTASPTTR